MAFETIVIIVFAVAMGIACYSLYQMSWSCANIIYGYLRPIFEKY